MARVIVGTAGHIDHGKSSLVRALTGTDPDRLPEEKRRGITIDLGFAFLDDVAAIIDVPGHERLIRNMVAGAATVDFALLVVAADDGIMPQTTEHLQILNWLGVRAGAVVLTKIDAVEPAWIALLKEDLRSALQGTLLDGAPVFEVDSLSGRGIPALRAELLTLLHRLPARESAGVFRLPIDRVFTVKGRGTVVTGTILSGTIDMNTRLAVMPGGFVIRIKQIESHGQVVERLRAGQRAALNLANRPDRLERGQTITEPGSLPVTTRIKVVFELPPGVPQLKDRQRLRILIGTQEALCRVQMLHSQPQGGYANLLLEEPIVAVWGDRFILRRYSPLETLGGGRVLEPLAPPLRAKLMPRELELAAALNSTDSSHALSEFIRSRGGGGISTSKVAATFGQSAEMLALLLDKPPLRDRIHAAGQMLLPAERYVALRANAKSRLTALHKQAPDASGFLPADILQDNEISKDVVEAIFADLVREGEVVLAGSTYHLPNRQIVYDAGQQRLQQEVLKILERTEFTPPAAGTLAELLGQKRDAIHKTLVNLERIGVCRRLGVDLFFTVPAFDRAIEKVRSALRSRSSLAVADVSTLLNSSRKYVVPLLEHLDAEGVTRRLGNLRVRGPKYEMP